MGFDTRENHGMLFDKLRTTLYHRLEQRNKEKGGWLWQ
jgi:hypothetical protein